MPAIPRQYAEDFQNEPNVRWPHVLVARYIGRLPDSMCEQPYSMTLQIDAVDSTSDSRAKLSGHIEYAASPAFYTMHDYDAYIDMSNRKVVISEVGETEEPFTFRGRLSENGRLIDLTATWGNHKRSEPFHLAHEEVVAHYIANHDEA